MVTQGRWPGSPILVFKLKPGLCLYAGILIGVTDTFFLLFTMWLKLLLSVDLPTMLVSVWFLWVCRYLSAFCLLSTFLPSLLLIRLALIC